MGGWKTHHTTINVSFNIFVVVEVLKFKLGRERQTSTNKPFKALFLNINRLFVAGHSVSKIRHVTS